MRRINHAGHLSAQERLAATLTLLATVGMAAIVERAAVYRSRGSRTDPTESSLRHPNVDLLVPDLPTSITEGNAWVRWSRRSRSALRPACWA